MTTALPRAATAGAGPLSAAQIIELLHDRLGGRVLETSDAYGQATVTVDPAAWVQAVRLAKSDPALACDFFSWLSAVDVAEQGFAVVVTLYSTRHLHHVFLRAVAPGGRENPRLDSVVDVYRGADWHERETYDMFGVVFEGRSALLPRILTVENFEGWPLRKEFHLSTRDAKPWPGAKEPEERHEETPAAQAVATVANEQPLSAGQKDALVDARAAEGGAGTAREEADMDQAVYDQLIAEGKSDRVARSRAKAAAMRSRKVAPAEAGQVEGAAEAQAAVAAGDPTAPTPEAAADAAAADTGDPSIAFDAAAGAVGGDVAAGAAGDAAGVDQPVDDLRAEVRVGTGAPPAAGGAPGPESEGRHAGAVEQSGRKPAGETAGMTSDQTAPPEPSQAMVPAPPDRAQRETALGSDAGTDQATPSGFIPPPAQPDDVPLVPQEGAEEAPLPSDDLLPGEQTQADESPLVHRDAQEPAEAYGTDAYDRRGPLYGASGSAQEPEADGTEGPTREST